MNEPNENPSEDVTKIDENSENVENPTSPRELELEAKIKELEDSYLRTRADFENTKKRLEREKSQSLEYAYEKFALELLPVIDSLEAALKSSEDSSLENQEFQVKFKEGLLLTLDNFYKVLERNGIEVIDTSGEFNPYLHECIMQVASENHNPDEIVQVFQKGYRYKERVLRSAMVSVCKAD